jgi:hypothetical protein
MSNDYQNHMKGETLAADKAGNAASDDFKGKNWQNGSGKLDQLGLLPTMEIPLDFALGRQQFFTQEIARTMNEGPDKPFMSDASIASSGALATQRQMLAGYISDSQLLPQASQEYGMFVPQANMAVRQLAKLQQVGMQTGMSTNNQTSDLLDKKHTAALRGAVVDEGMQRSDSVSLKAEAMKVARYGLISASAQIRVEGNKHMISKLRQEIVAAKSGKEEIEAKIAQVEQWCSYAERAAGLIAGGAGALGSAAAIGVEAEAGVADTTLETIKGGAEKAEKGSGIIGNVVGTAMTLYHHQELQRFDNQITYARGTITQWNMAGAENTFFAATAAMHEKATAYGLAVKQYQAAIDDRRMHMARAGAVADVKAGGKDQKSSKAMLWIESVMESKAILATATDTGTAGQAKLDSVRHQVVEHRGAGWSNIEDIWGSPSGTPGRHEEIGPDVKVLAQMSRLTDSWLKSSKTAQAFLDKSVGDAATGEAATLGKAGYTGEF